MSTEVESNGSSSRRSPRRSPRRSSKSPKKRKHSRSPKRSRSRSRRRHSRSGKRRSSRSRSRSRSRSKSRSKSRSPRRPKQRSPRPPEPPKEDENDEERMERTVLVHQLHPKVDERALFEFFSNVGKVKDIRLIRDSRTKRSKGLCYIEFWDKNSVQLAVALNGQLLGDHPVAITPTPKTQQAPKAVDTGLNLYLSNLIPQVEEKDIKPIFEAFGDVDAVHIYRDGGGKSSGKGYVHFKASADAKLAAEQLEGFEILRNPLKISLLPDPTFVPQNVTSLDNDISVQTRLALEAKRAGLPMIMPPVIPPAMLAMAVSNAPPSTCIHIKNMFDPAGEQEPDWDLDIRDDVQDECSKFGKVLHCFVDKNSAGHVYIRFVDIPSAEGAIKALHGRWFSSRQISCEYFPESQYDQKFPGSRP